MKAIIKKELYNYFKTPLALVFTVIYLISVSVFLFYFSGFLKNNEASLFWFFKINLWAYVFLIPSISMRLWSEEKKHGTSELLLTLPIGVEKLVLGKFFASLIFIVITLALTFPLVITVNYLGNPDNGIIIASYIANIFLAASFISIGLFFSSITKNQVIAFITTVLVCLFFVLIGSEKIVSLMLKVFSQDTVKIISSLGFISHFDSVLRGVLRLNDFIFFISFCGFWLFLATMSIEIFDKKHTIIKSILILIGFACLNIGSYYSFENIKYDVTSEKLYTLLDETKQVLDKLDDEVVIKAYISNNITEKGINFSDFSRRIIEVLDSYKSLSKGKIKVEIYDPKPFSKLEEDAISYGLYSIDVDALGNQGYFGIVAINSTGNIKKIPFIDMSEEVAFEYKLSKAIYDLSNNKKIKVGVLSGIEIDGVGISPLSAPTTFKPRWAIMEELHDNFDVHVISPYKYDIPEGLDVVVLINPSTILDKKLYGIDQYLMNGGKLLIFADPYMESENLYSENPVMNTNLSEVLKVWGIDYNDEKVVLDPYYATDVEIKKEGKKTFLSRLKIPNNNKNDGIMKNLKSFNFGSAGYLELAKQEGVEAEILLKSSKKASLLDLNKLLEINDLSSLITYYDDENTKEYPLIVKLKGEFNSAFVEPPSRIIGKKWTNDHKIHSSKEAEIIAVSDVDFLYEGFWAKRTYENGLKPVIHSVASNGDFVVSVIDYFSGRDFLNALKSKKKKDLRVLSKISDYINEIGTVYKKKEKMLEISLLELRKKMNEIMYGGKDVNNLSNDLDTLKLLDSEIFKAKREISILREDMLNKVNIMLNKIIWINTLAMPLFMLFLYFGLFLLKRKK